MPDPTTFTARLRERQRLIGYWVEFDSPVGLERVAGLGYDYICVDGQHGVLDRTAWRTSMLAIDARGVSAGLVRISSSDPAEIGAALDIGARGVIVPLVSSVEEAAAIVSASRFAPMGTRSFGGPTRSALRIGPMPAEANDEVACIAMIETLGGLNDAVAICETPGLDAVYVGPADLSISLGGRYPGDPAVEAEFNEALTTIIKAADASGIACGIQCNDGAEAAARLAQGFTFATASCDLSTIERGAIEDLNAARG